MGNAIKAIRGGTLIDGTGSKPMRDSVVIVEDTMITEIGPVGQVRIPSGADIIDASSCVVMPGLIHAFLKLRCRNQRFTARKAGERNG